MPQRPERRSTTSPFEPASRLQLQAGALRSASASLLTLVLRPRLVARATASRCPAHGFHSRTSRPIDLRISRNARCIDSARPADGADASACAGRAGTGGRAGIGSTVRQNAVLGGTGACAGARGCVAMHVRAEPRRGLLLAGPYGAAPAGGGARASQRGDIAPGPSMSGPDASGVAAEFGMARRLPSEREGPCSRNLPPFHSVIRTMLHVLEVEECLGRRG